MNLIDYGFDPTFLPDNTFGIPARVMAVHKERYELVCCHGQCYGRLKTGAYYGGNEIFPTTGDFVLIDYFHGGDSRITKTLARKSYFSRLDPSSSGHGEQAVAANFDYAFLMQSLNNDFNIHRMERYLTLAWQSGAVPVIILTKTDLKEDVSEQISEVEKMAPGVGVHAVSAKTGAGLDALGAYLMPKKTIVILGSSGVGKSSFVNALAGEEVMAISGIREDDSKGRHTTTHRQLVMLDSGVMIIDTPGMRELGMWNVSQGLGQSFADVEQYVGNCRFHDCKHQSEPGCGIKSAIKRGELSMERWNSYCDLKREARYADDKDAYLREKQEWHKAISKYSRSKKKNKERMF